MKVLLTGIFFVCLNTFTGSSFDTITKYLSINNYKWYHYYSIGGTAAIILFIFFLISIGGIKKHLILKQKNYYYLPVLRGISFIPLPLIVFFSLQQIPINLFTMLLMTSPFFLLIFAKFILKEKLNYIIDLKNIRRGRIQEYAEKYSCEYFEAERPWKVKCDVALPSATQNEINVEEAKMLVTNGCLCVSEGANMPTEPDAVHVLQKNGVLFGPGKAANAGGVAVSGLEMSQNAMRIQWSREEVDEKLQRIMVNIHDQCVRYGENGDKVDYVKGANIGGFIKVADAMLDQGVV